jgi:hypothetical protein
MNLTYYIFCKQSFYILNSEDAKNIIPLKSFQYSGKYPDKINMPYIITFTR